MLATITGLPGYWLDSGPALLQPCRCRYLSSAQGAAYELCFKLCSSDCCRTNEYIRDVFKQPAQAVQAWQGHWISLGLDALETELKSPETGKFCHGNSMTIADCYLVPQVGHAGALSSSSLLCSLSVQFWMPVEGVSITGCDTHALRACVLSVCLWCSVSICSGGPQAWTLPSGQ